MGVLQVVLSRHHLPPRGRDSRVIPAYAIQAEISAREEQQAHSLLLQLPDAVPQKQLALGVSRQVELQFITLQHLKGPNSIALGPVQHSRARTGLLSCICASSATGELPTTSNTERG